MGLNLKITIVCDHCGISYESEKPSVVEALNEARQNEFGVARRGQETYVKCPKCFLVEDAAGRRILGMTIGDVLQ